MKNALPEELPEGRGSKKNASFRLSGSDTHVQFANKGDLIRLDDDAERRMRHDHSHYARRGSIMSKARVRQNFYLLSGFCDLGSELRLPRLRGGRVDRHAHAEPRAPAWRAADDHLSTEKVHPLADADEAKAAALPRPGYESDT
jgi:hypothetical protein